MCCGRCGISCGIAAVADRHPTRSDAALPSPNISRPTAQQRWTLQLQACATGRRPLQPLVPRRDTEHLQTAGGLYLWICILVLYSSRGPLGRQHLTRAAGARCVNSSRSRLGRFGSVHKHSCSAARVLFDRTNRLESNRTLSLSSFLFLPLTATSVFVTSCAHRSATDR